MPGIEETIKQGLENTASFLGVVFRRIGVHAAILVAAVMLFDDWKDQLCVYIGLICLFPRGRVNDLSWLATTGLGLLQAAVLLPFYPPALAVFIGGCQTWGQRLLMANS